MTAFNGKILIDLHALKANWKLIRQTYTGGEVGAVVKANAYGLGESQVVRALLTEGCHTFFVSNLSEALSVRMLAPEAHIHVFSGCHAGEEREFEQANLWPVIVSKEMAIRWLRYPFKIRPKSSLKIDTGMGRYGLSLNDFYELLNDFTFENSGICMLMSHFSQSENVSHPQNNQQIVLFNQAFDRFKSKIVNAKASLCNSSGIFNFPNAHFDLARPGYSLYGGNPFLDNANPMLRVVSVFLPVVQLRMLKQGDCVGYGCDYRALKPIKVATVYGGYADGIFRSAADGVSLYFKGKRLPILGRISMDSLVVDITALENQHGLVEGDMLEFIGENNALDDVAKKCGTIGYELLTSLSRRFTRLYKGEQ